MLLNQIRLQGWAPFCFREERKRNELAVGARSRSVSLSPTSHLCTSELHASWAMAESGRRIWRRSAAYSSRRDTPRNSSGSSALIEHGTPAASSAGSWCRRSDGATLSSTFDVGHTSQHTCRAVCDKQGREGERGAREVSQTLTGLVQAIAGVGWGCLSPHPLLLGGK